MYSQDFSPTTWRHETRRDSSFTPVTEGAPCLQGTESAPSDWVRPATRGRWRRSRCRSALSLTYSSPTRGIGSRRTRTRAGSKVTMQPFSKESTSWGRLASSVRASTSGFRLPSPRNWMTDGWCDERAASSVPKSASAVTRIRPSTAARSKIASSSACCNPIERTWIAS